MKAYRYLILGAVLCLFSCKKETQSMDALSAVREQTKEFYQNQIQFMNEQIEDEGENAYYYYTRSRLYEADKKTELALQDVDKAILLDTSDGRYHYQRARILYQRGQLNEAVEAAQKADGFGFQEPNLYSLMGRCYAAQEDYINALEYLKRAMEIIPGDAETLYSIGTVYNARKDTTQAVKYFKESYAKKADYVKPYLELIKLYNERRLATKALYIAEKATKNCSPDVKLYTEIGKSLELSNQTDSAVYWYTEALRLDNTYWDLAKKLGEYYRKRKQPQVAVEFYKGVVKAHPFQKEAYFQLGYTYEFWYKNLNDAKAMYQKALDVDSLYTEGKVGLARVEKAIRWKEYLRNNPEVLEQQRKEKEAKEQEERLRKRLGLPLRD